MIFKKQTLIELGARKLDTTHILERIYLMTNV